MSTIKTGTTLTTAYQVEGDTTGSLVIQTGSTPTTALTIGSNQVVTFAQPPVGAIADGSVTTAKIADGAVTSVKIADANVTTAKIADANVTSVKLANSGVTAGTYGSASAIPAITVNAQGQVTSATTNAFSNAYAGYGAQLFTSSGTFTVPSGVSSVKVTCFGAGGGAATAGDNGGNITTGYGGTGGFAMGVYSVTPGAAITVTVGTGGTGAQGAVNLTTYTGTAGGSSSFGALISATGGGGGSARYNNGAGPTTQGTNGAGSSGNIANSLTSTPFSGSPTFVGSLFGNALRDPTTTSQTAPVAFSVTGVWIAGARGGCGAPTGGPPAATGGVGGAVLVEW